jgi:hypothetical protein
MDNPNNHNYEDLAIACITVGVIVAIIFGWI